MNLLAGNEEEPTLGEFEEAGRVIWRRRETAENRAKRVGDLERGEGDGNGNRQGS